MRIAWISPGYPPEPGGVSDHSFALVSALRGLGHDVLVRSNPQETGFARLDAELAAFRPEVVVVAYVPLGYAPRSGGIAPRFALWCSQLRRKLAAHTLLLAHEANLPAGEHLRRGELKLALLGAVHIAQFESLVRSFSSVAFSHEGNRQIWANRVPSRSAHFHTLRICSNIPKVASDDPTDDLRLAGYAATSPTVLFFGTGHSSVLFDYVEAAFTAISHLTPDAQLVLVGMDSAQLRRARPSLWARGAQVQALGGLPGRDVSLWLQASQLVLAPFVEGISARRGTVMAAMQHGRAVVTTSGFHTRADVPWDKICALSPLRSSAFADTAARCWNDQSFRHSLGLAAQEDYDSHASSRVTATRLLAIATGPVT